jgi:transposase
LTFLSSNSHLNALRIHQLEQERLGLHFLSSEVQSMQRIFVGVDVSKDHLDAYVRPTAIRQRFANTAAGIAELLAWLRPLAAERILFESTGPYQKAAVGALLAEGLPAVVVNARQVRDFAKAMNYLAKTDTIDAAVIAHFAEVANTTVRPLESQEIRDLRDLYDRRSQLVRMLAMEKNQRHAATVAQASTKVLKSIDKHIDYLEGQIQDLEQRMDHLIENSTAFQARDAILQTITGIGPQVSRTLIAHLPELGRCSRQSIAALVCLAPYNDDSGAHHGQRHIRGGRAKVRVGLYQAAIAAIRHCDHMKAFYASLKARGKASRVAIIAVARKLLVLANAMIRDMAPYKAPANSVC